LNIEVLKSQSAVETVSVKKQGWIGILAQTDPLYDHKQHSSLHTLENQFPLLLKPLKSCNE